MSRFKENDKVLIKASGIIAHVLIVSGDRYLVWHDNRPAFDSGHSEDELELETRPSIMGRILTEEEVKARERELHNKPCPVTYS